MLVLNDSGEVKQATTVADGADVAIGATTDAAVTTDTAGTLSGKLRGLIKWAFERMPAALGQGTMAQSLRVVVASDQSSVPVSAASLPLPSGASTAALQTQPGVDIGDVTVNNAAGGSAVNIQDGGNTITVDGTVTANGTLYGVRLDEATATITYVGQAAPGTATSAAAWSIKRLDSTSGLVVLWADGDANFNNIWDDRASLSYS
jgi:hypothetical protein